MRRLTSPFSPVIEVSPVLRPIVQRSARSSTTMAVLFLINLLNYMDRFTIAGVLDQIQVYFNIGNASAGLLQTVFICSYMILAPLFGYMGDRYSRRLIMAFGIFVWSLTTFVGSFIPSNMFALFVLCRCLVGIGEASYSCVAPSVIADLYEGDTRSKMLAIYYLAIPIGSGLGYIVGSKITNALSGWQWALRVTPPIAVLCIFLLIFILKEPSRGHADGGDEVSIHSNRTNAASSYCNDLRSLAANRSYIGTTLSFTAVAFVVGALSWWAPNFMKLAYELAYQNTSTPVSLIFGIITCLAGICGVVIGSTLSRRLKPTHENADALICGFAVLASVPFLFAAIYTTTHAKLLPLAWTFVFVAITLLCFISFNHFCAGSLKLLNTCVRRTWSLIADIILYVIVPARRATAEAFQILVSHLLGDAGSPYLIGLISDQIYSASVPSKIEPVTVLNDTNNVAIVTHPLERFKALQQSLYINAFVTVLGAAGFLITAFYIAADRRAARVYMRASMLRNSIDDEDEDGDNEIDNKSNDCV